ncbi:hypothetical protein F2Q69_00046307 [Brassica cretica]|uniref:Carbonic anhydrase n=1 Tax=Brassica cretica TaxID=69181 RepID=A0A8S9PVL3_BRACR|nr:hypothetical protein F2Q69_00046307 [Brassica cretica]
MSTESYEDALERLGELFRKKPSLYNALAKSQDPKFLVFACSDSRVSPAHILNFQPGEAFEIRNIANMVPLFDKTQHSGTGAAMEYPITKLNVENILVIGHSRCGGIEALMSIEDDAAPNKSIFIEDWVKIGTAAKNRIKQEFGDLSFEEQCTLCEKFLVFACSDSRVSPAHVLNFQPGEAFEIRNIANMVPLFDKTQHSGTGAAMEYPITKLNVENILVIGHSRCGGIEALMSIEDDAAPNKSIFIEDWVKIGTAAKNRIKQEFGDLSFEEQCTLCEKEAVNVTLANLLSYPFVRERVEKGKLALRGAHYDFVNGTFELWELDVKTTTAFTFS